MLHNGETVTCTFNDKKLGTAPNLAVTKNNDANHDNTFSDVETVPANVTYPYVVTYQLVIVNNSATAGTITSISDDKTNVAVATSTKAPTCASLVGGTIGANATLTCYYDVTFANANTPQVINTATVAATNAFGTSTKSDTSTVNFTAQARSLAIVKTATPQTYNAVNQIISYSYLVTNNGNVTLAGPFTVNDDRAADESCPVTASLAPGASITCTASYQITQADLDAGSVTNIAFASGGGATSPTDTETVTAVVNKSLAIVKTATPGTYNAVNQTISYSYLVTNNGNVTLAGPFTVSDDKATDESCPATVSLAPGASITCTASYQITQADLDAGSVTNVAFASGGGATSPSDTETVTAVQNAALTLVKTATPASYDSVGNVIGYSYLVTNAGNVTLAGPFTVNDDKAADESCPATASLAPGASITCTATYTIGQADLDAGSVTNTATATNGAVTSNQDSETVHATQNLSLLLVKTATPGTYDSVNQVISYSYLVTNVGNVTLAGPFTVNDNKATVTCPADTSLAVGASITCTATYTIGQADLDAGLVTNTATATNGTVTSNEDTETVTAVQNAALTLVKTATPQTYNAVNQIISYSYLVTNAGNVTLAGPFTVSDDKATDESCPATVSLAPGASITCTATYTIGQADLDAGSVTNTATATNGTVTSNQDSETVTAVQAPALTLVKTATPGTYSAVGATISYSYKLTNSGNVTLAGPFTVSDNKATVTCPADTSLAVGASITCTASYVVTQADLDAGSVTNTATATNGTVVSNPDSETVTAVVNKSLAIVKTATPQTYDAVNQTISYSYLVTNAGNVTLSGPFTVDDDKATDESCPADTSLAPGASITCTASYKITQADLDAGSVTNVASASGGGATSPTDSETVTAVQAPALLLVKTATPGTYTKVGDVISYSYLVTNVGNVTLAGPFTVDDDKATVTCPTDTSLAVGASITCTASYVVTQADLDAGSVTNTATATNGTVVSNPDSETVTAVQAPALTLVKTATPQTYSAVGDVISYSYLVTNNGNVTLAGPFTVNDDKATDESCPATATLAPGASITCTASYQITQADLDAGSVTNVASASGGGATSPTDTETVTAVQAPALLLVKTATPQTYSAVGDVISYSYLVTNSGNVTLAGPFTVDDDKATVTCPTDTSLAVGASITCTATYTIGQADLDAGLGDEHGDGDQRHSDVEPGQRDGDGGGEQVAGDREDGDAADVRCGKSDHLYSYLVTNNGNVTLAGPFTVSDDKATDESCPADGEPGARRIDHLHCELQDHTSRPGCRLGDEHRVRHGWWGNLADRH